MNENDKVEKLKKKTKNKLHMKEKNIKKKQKKMSERKC